jgi:DNA-binding NarL/FixJ family response regulator
MQTVVVEGLEELTPAERHVLELMAAGLSNAGIASVLHLSPRTVESHVKWIFRKLGLWPSDHEHRRVLAVRAFLLAGPEDAGTRWTSWASPEAAPTDQHR